MEELGCLTIGGTHRPIAPHAYRLSLVCGVLTSAGREGGSRSRLRSPVWRPQGPKAPRGRGGSGVDVRTALAQPQIPGSESGARALAPDHRGLVRPPGGLDHAARVRDGPTV